MKNEANYLKEYLNKYDVNASNIRLYILDLLLTTNEHLTVEDMYKELRKTVPTLSKTSVYNALELFLEHKVIRQIKLDEKEARYDIKTNPHGHFKCIKCDRIYDFDIEDGRYKNLENFKIIKEDIQIYGICEMCM